MGLGPGESPIVFDDFPVLGLAPRLVPTIAVDAFNPGHPGAPLVRIGLNIFFKIGPEQGRRLVSEPVSVGDGVVALFIVARMHLHDVEGDRGLDGQGLVHFAIKSQSLIIFEQARFGIDGGEDGGGEGGGGGGHGNTPSDWHPVYPWNPQGIHHQSNLK